MPTPFAPFQFIDSHHHLWGGAAEPERSPYLLEDYLAEFAPLGLRASVFMECHTHYDRSLPAAAQALGETRFAAAIGGQAQEPLMAVAAIVARLDMIEDDFAGLLAAHVAAGQGRLRGIRRVVAWDADPALQIPVLRTAPSMLADPRFDAALDILAAHDLHFETWLFHPQLDELTALATRVPHAIIILNHAGTPLGIGRHRDPDRTWRDWLAAIGRASERPYMLVKIGGLAGPWTAVDQRRRALGLDAWTVEALAEALDPYLRALIAAFGPERCLFESNFPVDRAYCDAATLIAAHVQTLACLPGTDQRAIFAGNAARRYRIALPDS
ncbi:putative TIM-barrel fold metal-dependent hydrolase [Sphingobium sp. AEW010]|nr:putative TIM-barrel fold metal-dependent hydrolase [Sphingobium sp. AEW010]TWD23254.1 putative TIM-barrel fold metal-dependent hydrolase [Sphingobium sp. AEW013]TWD25114.1 putative TIM-barrel fold metal-dependent hydrolase [Sphingobium sp. AEW001]